MISSPSPIPILVVEDNVDNMKLVSWVLEDAGYASECVGSAEEGLEALSVQPFGLVLMDISLPGIDGKEATRCIRSDERTARLPVIAMTAHAVRSETDLIWGSGVSALLTKPLNEAELLAVIRSFLTEEKGNRA
jgi:two-component system cell cycle response regulator DivK